MAARIAEAPLAGAVCVGGLILSVWIAPGWAGLAGGVLAILMTAIAVIDRRTLTIPDELNAAAFLTGLAASGLRAESLAEGLLQGATRAAVTFALFFVLRAAFRLLRGVEGLGFGDVKLAGVAGVWVDWVYLPLVVNIAALTALTAVFVQHARSRRLDFSAKLPFGAFLAPAIWLCWAMMTWSERASLSQAFGQ